MTEGHIGLPEYAFFESGQVSEAASQRTHPQQPCGSPSCVGQQPEVRTKVQMQVTRLPHVTPVSTWNQCLCERAKIMDVCSGCMHCFRQTGLLGNGNIDLLLLCWVQLT